jgi:hypothetical protein
MANNGKFLNLTSGVPTLEAGATTGGAGDANKVPALDAAGKLPMAMMPTGVNNEALSIVASEAIAAGAFVNIYSNAGTLNIRNADNSAAGKEAHGFVLAAVSSSATGTVYLPSSINTGQTGRTVGARQFLGTVGTAVETAPTASGTVVQIIGQATATTTVVFNPHPPITIS